MDCPFKKKEKELYLRGLAEAQAAARDKDPGLLAKIKNHCGRFDDRCGSAETVLEQCAENPLVASFFVKNPGRTNFHEKVVAEYLGVLPGFRKLPAQGDNAIHLSPKGNIGNKKKLSVHGGTNLSRALDFAWRHGDKTVYASHKYTAQEGGAQDNQYKEQQNLLSRAALNKDPDIVVVAMCDGEYYTPKRFEALRNLGLEDKALAMTLQETREFFAK